MPVAIKSDPVLSVQGAITTFTKGLATHLIERGIRVNAIAPGPIWTPLIQQSYDKEKVMTHNKVANTEEHYIAFSHKASLRMKSVVWYVSSLVYAVSLYRLA